MINDLQPELIQFLIIVSIMIISFMLEIVAMEVTALGAIVLLLVFNIITIYEALSGFIYKAVITIVAIFIFSRSLVNTVFLVFFSYYLFRFCFDVYFYIDLYRFLTSSWNGLRNPNSTFAYLFGSLFGVWFWESFLHRFVVILDSSNLDK